MDIIETSCSEPTSKPNPNIMPRVSSKFITMCYDNYPDLKEFVFSCKGRPFAMLSSQQIPVPTLSLIDFDLAQDLGMKLKDIQCSKFTFAGSKLRILGKISQTIQCVKDGKLQGNVHIKANVVEDLKKTFDTHSIAGEKMTKLLFSSEAAVEDPSPVSKKSDKVKTSPPPSPTPSVTRSCHSGFGGSPVRNVYGTASPVGSSSGRSTFSTPSPGRSSPPGFPSVPQYSRQQHQPEVTHDEPMAPMNKPPPGYRCRRRLQLKPARNKYRNWHQGRVVEIIRPGLAFVDVLRPGGKACFSEYCQYPGLRVEVNDVVLFHDHDFTPDLSWDGSKPHIRVVYSEEEVDQLKARGVEIPDCPP